MIYKLIFLQIFSEEVIDMHVISTEFRTKIR